MCFSVFLDTACWLKCLKVMTELHCVNRCDLTLSYNLPICNKIELLPTYRAQLESRAPFLCQRVVSFILMVGPRSAQWLCSDCLCGSGLTSWLLTSLAVRAPWVGTRRSGLFVSSAWVKLQSSTTWVCSKCQQFSGSQKGKRELNVK